MSDGPAWFAPKRVGNGATPVTWQGWLVTLAYIVVIAVAALLLRDDRPLAFGAILILATLLLILIASRTTRGGWRWRWENRE